MEKIKRSYSQPTPTPRGLPRGRSFARNDADSRAGEQRQRRPWLHESAE
jgi:hypothetical protein